jgi:hypothetical protein
MGQAIENARAVSMILGQTPIEQKLLAWLHSRECRTMPGIEGTSVGDLSPPCPKVHLGGFFKALFLEGCARVRDLTPGCQQLEF